MSQEEFLVERKGFNSEDAIVGRRAQCERPILGDLCFGLALERVPVIFHVSSYTKHAHVSSRPIKDPLR